MTKRVLTVVRKRRAFVILVHVLQTMQERSGKPMKRLMLGFDYECMEKLFNYLCRSSGMSEAGLLNYFSFCDLDFKINGKNKSCGLVRV